MKNFRIFTMKRADFFTFYQITKNLQLNSAGSIWVSFVAHEQNIFPFKTV